MPHPWHEETDRLILHGPAVDALDDQQAILGLTHEDVGVKRHHHHCRKPAMNYF